MERPTHRWDGSSIVGYSGTGAVTYYRGINIIAQNKKNAVNYYVYDGHGNTVTLTDANGATVSKCDYSAYGNRTSIKSYINTPFKYCGEYQDNESGMVYLRNRYYKINEGRFTQEDPAKDGLNWYAYCGNNPVNFVDPWGLYFVMSQESYVKLNALAKIVFGSDDFNLAYKTNGDSIIIDKDNWDYDDIDTGSETGKALLKDLICSDSEIKVSFTNSDEKSIYDSSAGIDYIDLINIDIDNADVNMMNEYSTILIHEAAHTYSEVFGAMKAANIFAVNKDFGNIDTKKKHGEAIAITVEERYRQEMGFSKRDKSRGEIGGVNDYGAWIQNLPYTVLWEVSDDLTESMPGVTLLNTYFIWYDIISRAKEIK